VRFWRSVSPFSGLKSPATIESNVSVEIFVSAMRVPSASNSAP